MDTTVKKAVILVSGYDGKDQATIPAETKFAGEPILRRSILACQKAGIDRFFLIHPPSEKERLEAQLLNKRITSRITWIASAGSLETDLHSALQEDESPETPALIFELDTFVHPTLLQKLTGMDATKSYLCAWGNLQIANDSPAYRHPATATDKYLLRAANHLNRISVDSSAAETIDEGEIPVNPTSYGTSAQPGTHFFSLDLVVSALSRLSSSGAVDSFPTLVERLVRSGQLRIYLVSQGIWCKLRGKRSAATVRSLIFSTVTKKTSGPVSRYLNRHMSRPITTMLLGLGLSPNLSTSLTVLTAFAACFFLLLDGYLNLVLAGFFWHMAAVVDRCDGEVARVRHYETKWGGWLDTFTDNVEYVVFVICLALGMYLSPTSLVENKMVYLQVSGVVLITLIFSVVFGVLYMNRKGLHSFQVLGEQYSQNVKDKGLLFRSLDTVRTLGKRDVWSFLVFLFCVANQKEFIYWGFMTCCFILAVGIVGAFAGDFKKTRTEVQLETSN